MIHMFKAYLIVAFALAATTVAQPQPQDLSFNGCSKNCALCSRNGQMLPFPGISSRTCDACINSSPRQILPLHFDCSGAAIPNCYLHALDKQSGSVRCILCNDGFDLKSIEKTSTCEPMSGQFSNCLKGISGMCVQCKNGLTLRRQDRTTPTEPVCYPVDTSKRIANCQTHLNIMSSNLSACISCFNNFQLSEDGQSCTLLPVEKQMCLKGWESNLNLASCTGCNIEAGYLSTDAIFSAGQQRQVCTKSGGLFGGPMIFIIIGAVLVVVVVVVIILLKRGKSNNEVELKGSMVSQN